MEHILKTGREKVHALDYTIRKIEQSEIGILSDFLYEAIFVPEGEALPPREIIETPELQVYIDDETPSFAISLYKEYRKRGIGTALMRAMLAELGKSGRKQASLSVQKANYAVKMYEDVGFTVAAEHGDEYIMVCRLSD